MKIAVVIPNWNGAKYLAECLDSLLNQSLPADIIVVENNSTDGSRTLLKKYPNVITLPQAKNLGVAGGFNAGFEFALNNHYDYAALFNNDAVADRQWLQQLVTTMSHHQAIGIVTGKFLQFDKTHLDSTGDFYTIYGLPFPRGRNEVDNGQYDHATVIFGGSGGASLYRVAMLRQIGLFDNDFFAYFEDVDISFRAQLAGWQVAYQPQARAYHRLSATTSQLNGFTTYHTAKNLPLLYLKNMPAKLFVKYLPLVIYWYCRMLVARMIKGGLLAFIKGALMALFLTPKKIMARHVIQQHRQATVQYIDGILIHHQAPKPPHIT